jgi:hypothetical protein
MSNVVCSSRLYLLDDKDFVMGEVVGCCGLVCSDCQIYLATQSRDEDLRATIFQRQKNWGHDTRFRELYGREYRLEDVHCGGYPTSSQGDFWYIENCGMRACALRKNHPNCAHCDEYPCDQLKGFFDKSHVNARKTLDEIRSQIACKE